MSHGNPFILSKVKGQGHKAQNIAGMDHGALVSAGFSSYSCNDRTDNSSVSLRHSVTAAKTVT